MTPAAPFVAAVAALVLVAMPRAASAQEQAVLPATAATCDQLRGWLGRYDFEKGSQHLSGRRLRSDVALALCAAGRYDEGVAILERIAREAGYSFPSK